MAISDYKATFTMPRRYSPQWTKAQFNDEIQQQQQLGIGQAAEELSVTWILSRSDGNSLDNELQALADARTPFSYQPC
jgi:phage-related protein